MPGTIVDDIELIDAGHGVAPLHPPVATTMEILPGRGGPYRAAPISRGFNWPWLPL